MVYRGSCLHALKRFNREVYYAVVSVVTLSKSVKKKAKAMSSNLLILFCKYRKTTKNLKDRRVALQSAMFCNSGNLVYEFY